MKLAFIIVLISFQLNAENLAPIDVPIRLPKTNTLSAVKAAPAITSKDVVIQFKYPTNINLKVWHDTVTFISMDMIHWQPLGTNVTVTQLTKKVPVFVKQCMIIK